MFFLVAKLCPTFCDTMEYNSLDSSVHEILQARILEWVVIHFSRGSSWPRDWTQVSCIAGRFFTIQATRDQIMLIILLQHYWRVQTYINMWHSNP